MATKGKETTGSVNNCASKLDKLFELVTEGESIKDFLLNNPSIDINALHINGSDEEYSILQFILSRGKKIIVEDLDALLAYPGLDIDFKGKMSLTPLFYFVSKVVGAWYIIPFDYLAIIEKLLRKLPDLNSTNDNQETLLVFCIKNMAKDFELIKLLLEQENIDVNKQCMDNNPCVHWLYNVDQQNLTTEQNECILKLFLRHKLNINETVSSRTGPLFHYVFKLYKEGHISLNILEDIIKEDTFDPNQHEDQSPLMLAVADEKYISLIKLLLLHPKIDVNHQDMFNQTALMHSSSEKIDALLLEHKDIDINMVSNNRSTKIRMIVSHSTLNMKALDNLMKHPGYDPNKVYSDDKTDLIWSVTVPNKGSVPLYKKRYPVILNNTLININTKDNYGKNALTHAAKLWRVDAMNDMFEHSTMQKDKLYCTLLNNQDSNGRTFIHDMCMSVEPYHQVDENMMAILKKLIHTADVNLQDNKGYTAIMRAIENCTNNTYMADIVVILLSHPKKCDLSVKNMYEQDVKFIKNICEENNKLNDKVKSLLSTALGEDILVQQSSLPLEDQVKVMRNAVMSKEASLNKAQQEHLNFILNIFEETLASYNKGSQLDVDNEFRKKLMDNFYFIIQQLEVMEVACYLLQENVITEYEFDTIKTKKPRQEKAVYLISLVAMRGKSAYDAFTDALRKTCQEFIVDEIDKPKTSTDLVVQKHGQLYAPNTVRLDIPEGKKVASLTLQITDGLD